MIMLALAFIVIAMTGCATLQNGRGWGQDAIFPVDLKRIPRAAFNALLDLQTLIPAAGALAFTVDHFDRNVSDWASSHTPIFGSKSAADNATSPINTALEYEWLLTALATPSGDNPKDWAYSKIKGIAVEWAAQKATDYSTTFLKERTKRTRPDGSDNQSLPSSGASDAFSYVTLANRNLNFVPLPDKVRISLQVGNILLATTEAWSRIEAGKHFPSDVLAGAALGNFLSVFIHDAFMGLPKDDRLGFYILPSKHGAMIGLSFGF